MNKIKLFVISLGLVSCFGLATLPSMAAAADSPLSAACEENPDATVCKNQNTDINGVISAIVNTLLFGIGVVSVGMIIFAGVRYSTSMGDAGNITKAKNTLLYAVIGLVVALLAYPIVHWVVDRLIPAVN